MRTRIGVVLAEMMPLALGHVPAVCPEQNFLQRTWLDKARS